MWNSSVQQPSKNGKPWKNTQQQTNGDASDLGVTQPLHYIFLHLNIFPRCCYLPALSHTMTVLSCPLLLQIRCFEKEAAKSTQLRFHLRYLLSIKCGWELSSWVSLPSTSKSIMVPLSCHLVEIWTGTVSCRWKVSRRLHRRAGSHGWDRLGRVGGSREEKGVSRKEHDGFVSHIIDWPPRWAYCGDQFPVSARETFTGELVEWLLSGWEE